LTKQSPASDFLLKGLLYFYIRKAQFGVIPVRLSSIKGDKPLEKTGVNAHS
jgi:hypothetical protein